MSSIIFCPNCDALILDAARCPACGKWERPPQPPAGRGALAWRTDLPAALACSLTLADAVLYACDADGKLHALDAATGAPRWKQPADLGDWRVYRQVAVAAGMVLVGPSDSRSIPAADKEVLALDAATGAVRWRCPLNARQVSDPAISGDAVYVATSDGQAAAMGLADGTMRWRVRIAGIAQAAPGVAGEIILFGGDKGMLTALHAQDGSLAWMFQVEPDPQWGASFPYPPVYAGGRVYVTCWNRRCYALEAGTGQQVWASEPTKRPPLTPPAVNGGNVYFCGHDRYVYCLNIADGAIRWRTQLPRRSVTTPVLIEGQVYITSQDHRIYALDVVTGQLGADALLETERHVEADWATDGERVYLGDVDGRLYAVALRAPAPEVGPETLAARGMWPEAAVRYALTGDLVRAAEIYGKELSDPRHAARLFERAGDKGQAAAQFERAGELKLARTLYSEAGRHEDAARVALALGDQHTAAQAYEQINRWEEAANLYAGLGSAALPQAAHAFERAAETAAQQGSGKAAQECWLKAAEAYHKLHQPEKAVQLYHRAGRRDRADYVIREERDPAIQVLLMRIVAGPEELARWFSEQGQYAAAAEEYVRLKRPTEAAQMYEQRKEYVLAAEQYRIAEQWADAGRMMEAAGTLGEAAALYLKAGDRPRAAALYARQNRWLDAAQLYEEINDWKAAARAWVTGGELDRAAEAWERGGELAQAAAAWQHLGFCDRAAEDYWQAAEAAQARKETGEAVAALYDLAMQGFEDCGRTQRAEECDAVRRFLRRQPFLTLKPTVFGGFTEGHSGKLQVRVKNVGWGQASTISFKVTGAFEIDLELAAKPFGLAPDVTRDVPLYIVPQRAGSPLPLHLTLTYMDAHGKALPPVERAFDITVRPKDERRGDSTPIIIGDGGKIIHMGSGDYVEDGQVKIERHAPSATPTPAQPTAVSSDTSSQTVETHRIACVNCGTEQPADRFKCVKCGIPFARCVTCQRALPERTDFCQHCGATQ